MNGISSDKLANAAKAEAAFKPGIPKTAALSEQALENKHSTRTASD
jgi:hypothetical protein